MFQRLILEAHPDANRHPKLRTRTGTIRLSPADAVDIPDDELRDLVAAALDA